MFVDDVCIERERRVHVFLEFFLHFLLSMLMEIVVLCVTIDIQEITIDLLVTTSSISHIKLRHQLININIIIGHKSGCIK